MDYSGRHLEKASGMEVLLRRLHSLYLADSTGSWIMAEVLEEVPGPNSPHLHENLCRNLMNQAMLIHKFRASCKGSGSKDPNE